ncbi:MAG: endonuclease MutS2 [Desulfomonilia bacterium]|jgi:DNA mismatch repair protein MutS2|nr:Smr/MutS family protein [Desulfomonilia bacterium]
MEEDLLEFSALKSYIRSFVASDMGSSAADKLGPLDSWVEVRGRWALLGEMISLVMSGEETGFSAVPDIRELLDIHEGVILEGKDIVMVAGVITDTNRVKHNMEKAGSALASLAAFMEPLEDIPFEINSTLLPTGEISDSASPVLRRLRKQARTLRAAILEKLSNIMDGLKKQSMVMEDLVTVRNERYVIPLRHDYGSHIKGITHDYSRSNKTAYVEPLAVVDENNTLNQIRSDIKEEEIGILRDLTSLILAHGAAIRENLETYGRLDLIHASACWAIKHNAVIPGLSREGIEIEGARHPVLLNRLGRNRTVPLDIRMPGDKDCLIISGPNAGGKTVALKTLGLLMLMAKSGLAIPAKENSVIYPVGTIWVEMDTNQDIQHGLSSFTAHALSLKKIYEGLAEGDLVLLDEPGTGTDPAQGAAIAVSCIDAYRKKGARVVVTSHADLIKLYGLSSQGVENAATAFDDTGHRPLYCLQYGVIGQSRAFDILTSIDFPQEILREAEGIASREGSSALAKAMEDMANTASLKEQAAREAEQAAIFREKAEQAYQEMEREKVELSLRYRRIMEQVKELSRKPQPKERIERVRASDEAREIEAVLQNVEPARVLEVQPGSSVILKGTGARGRVVDVSRDQAQVLMGDKRLKVNLDQVEPTGPDEEGKRERVRVRSQVSSGYVFPVKVVGMRVDEALPIVEKAVDQALISGQPQIEIIHGSGTGRLKSAIRAYLKGLGVVKGISDSPMSEGGGNKTIVMFEAG